MSEKKVNVVSKVNYPISVSFPELRFSRTWERLGASKAIDYDIIEEGMSDPGFEYMIKTGMLYIEDMDIKKALDIEPEDAKEPVNIIVYTDKEIKSLLTTKSVASLEEALEKTTDEQKKVIAQRAIELKITNLEKARILKEATGIDVVYQLEENAKDEAEAKTKKAKK